MGSHPTPTVEFGAGAAEGVGGDDAFLYPTGVDELAGLTEGGRESSVACADQGVGGVHHATGAVHHPPPQVEDKMQYAVIHDPVMGFVVWEVEVRK